MTSLTLFSPAGAVPKADAVKRAAKRLAQLGFEVAIDADALSRQQRFAGDDAARLAALHRIADAAPSVALATRGGYGLTRLLDKIDWSRIASSIERGTRWVGYSDLTALQNDRNPPPYCGDGMCNGTESHASCPSDCELGDCTGGRIDCCGDAVCRTAFMCKKVHCL